MKRNNFTWRALMSILVIAIFTLVMAGPGTAGDHPTGDHPKAGHKKADHPKAAGEGASMVIIKGSGAYAKAALISSPSAKEVVKNEIVVWMNMVAGKEVKLIFEEGKTCRDVTTNPNLRIAGFFLDSKGCYSTSFMDFAATTSLQFPEAGTFEYKLLSEDGLEGMGKIVVK